MSWICAPVRLLPLRLILWLMLVKSLSRIYLTVVLNLSIVFLMIVNLLPVDLAFELCFVRFFLVRRMIRRFSDLYEDVLRKSGFRHASVRPSYADHPYTCPFKIRMTRYCNGRHIPFYVPCGRCLYCQQHRADDWVTRQFCEASVSTQVFFTTLTYDDPHLEDISRYTLQCFFKRLRKAGLVFRYIALAEYGPKTCRSHYHILFFLNSVKHFSCPAHFSRWISFFGVVVTLILKNLPVTIINILPVIPKSYL